MNTLEMQIMYYLTIQGDSQKMVLHLLETDDFELPESKFIFSTAKGLAMRDKPVDFVELLDVCYAKGYNAYLNDCNNYFSPDRNVLSLIQRLKTKSIKRFTIYKCTQILEELKKDKIEELSEISDRFAVLSKSISMKNPDYKEQDIGELIKESINGLSKVSNDLVKSGIPSLDLMLKGGLRKADYCVIAARPSVGKSALCLDFLLNTAISGKYSLMFSTEMPKEQVMIRAVSKISTISMDKILGVNDEKMDSEEGKRFAYAYSLLSKSKMMIYDDKITVSSIMEAYYNHKSMGNEIRLIVVDYIQQLKPEGKYTKAEEALSAMTNQFLRLAVDENITVIVVAQLNREVSPYDAPELSNIKGCGTIEQDVTVALMLSLEKNDEHTTYVNLRKFRNGKNYQTTALKFYGSCMLFRD